MKTLQMCSGRRYGSTDMQCDLFLRSGQDNLRSRLEVDLFRSIYSSFNATQLEKDDSGKFNAILGCKKLLVKKCPQNVHFLSCSIQHCFSS